MAGGGGGRGRGNRHNLHVLHFNLWDDNCFLFSCCTGMELLQITILYFLDHSVLIGGYNIIPALYMK